MSYGNLHRLDRLFLPQQMLLLFSAQIPTPFFLYDADGIRKAARTVRGSFLWNRGHKPWFPLMANTSPAILQILREEGFGLLAQSEQELRYAYRCGFAPEEILFHTPAMTDRAAMMAKQLGCGVIFDAPGQIEKFVGQLPSRCLLRFCPERTGYGSGFAEHTDRGKSGMNHDRLLAAAARLSELGAKEIGLHCQLASNVKNGDDYPAVADLLFSLAAELRNRLGVEIACCDLGGGIGKDQNLPKIGTVIRDRFREAFPNSDGPAIFTELGRCLLQPHGILVCRVAEVREHSRPYMILDASASALPWLTEHRERPHISVVGNCGRSGRRVWAVYGCSADSHDRFSDRAMLPSVSPGAVVAIHNAGAYGASAQNCLNMLPSCDSYLYTCRGDIVSADPLTASEEML